MIRSPSVQVTHWFLEQVFPGSRASSSSSAEQLLLTGSSLGVRREQSGKIVQGSWAQRHEEGGQQNRFQDSPSPLGSLAWHGAGGALTQKNCGTFNNSRKSQGGEENHFYLVLVWEISVVQLERIQVPLHKKHSHRTCENIWGIWQK